MSDSLTDRRLPACLSRCCSYEVIPPGRLGSGHFGTVLAVRDASSQRTCVLKLFRKAPNDVFLLVREKNFLVQAARSGCRYIIGFVDDWVDEEAGHYLVLTPLCRENMEQRLKRAERRKEDGDADDYSYGVMARYLLQVTEALAALHRMRIIHCDLALRNILLTYSDEIRLCDFGVAEDERKGGVTSKRSWKNKSVSLAPEMSRDAEEGSRFDSRADCWSLGVLVYALLLKSAAVAMEQHVSRDTLHLRGR